MLSPRQGVRAVIFASLSFLWAAAYVSSAAAQVQNFTLTASQLSPSAGLDPGETATGTVTLSTSTGYTGSVALSCTVTPPVGVTLDLPACEISPATATPNAVLSLTLTTVGATVAGTYIIGVSGTSGGETESTLPIPLSVVPVAQDYTLTVLKTISPTTVTAGGGAQATIAVTPIGSYTGSVTIACLSITPTVTASPICTFNPPTVTVTNGPAPTSVLTISTYGTQQNQARMSPARIFYAFCFALPGFVFMAAGARGRRSGKLWGVLLLILVAGALLMLPSCGGTTTAVSNNSNGYVTPKNTYTITLSAVDGSGLGPSNSTTNSSVATISLTVN